MIKKGQLIFLMRWLKVILVLSCNLVRIVRGHLLWLGGRVYWSSMLQIFCEASIRRLTRNHKTWLKICAKVAFPFPLPFALILRLPLSTQLHGNLQWCSPQWPITTVSLLGSANVPMALTPWISHQYSAKKTTPETLLFREWWTNRNLYEKQLKHRLTYAWQGQQPLEIA